MQVEKQYTLHTAIHHTKNESIVEYLLGLKDSSGGKVFDVNGENQYKETPLHVAAKIGNSKIIKLLLDNGANIRAKWKEKTALDIVNKKAGLKKCEDYLWNAKELLDIFKNCGRNATRDTDKSFFETFNFNTIHQLCTNWASIHIIDENHNTLLHNAINNYADPEVVKFLIERDIDVNAKNKDTQTALDTVETKISGTDTAEKGKYEKIKQYLENADKIRKNYLDRQRNEKLGAVIGSGVAAVAASIAAGLTVLFVPKVLEAFKVSTCYCSSYFGSDDYSCTWCWNWRFSAS